MDAHAEFFALTTEAFARWPNGDSFLREKALTRGAGVSRQIPVCCVRNRP